MIKFSTFQQRFDRETKVDFFCIHPDLTFDRVSSNWSTELILLSCIKPYSWNSELHYCIIGYSYTASFSSEVSKFRSLILPDILWSSMYKKLIKWKLGSWKSFFSEGYSGGGEKVSSSLCFHRMQIFSPHRILFDLFKTTPPKIFCRSQTFLCRSNTL